MECLGGRTKQKGEQHPPRIFSQGFATRRRSVWLSVRCACGEGWVLDCAGWWVAVRAPAACAGWADDVDGDVDITVKKKAETRNRKRERHLALLALPPFTWNSVFSLFQHIILTAKQPSRTMFTLELAAALHTPSSYGMVSITTTAICPIFQFFIISISYSLPQSTIIQ